MSKIDTHELDVGKLIATGAMAGPYRRTRPVSLSLRQCVLRWFRLRFGRWIYR